MEQSFTDIWSRSFPQLVQDKQFSPFGLVLIAHLAEIHEIVMILENGTNFPRSASPVQSHCTPTTKTSTTIDFGRVVRRAPPTLTRPVEAESLSIALCDVPTDGFINRPRFLELDDRIPEASPRHLPAQSKDARDGKINSAALQNSFKASQKGKKPKKRANSIDRLFGGL